MNYMLLLCDIHYGSYPFVDPPFPLPFLHLCSLLRMDTFADIFNYDSSLGYFEAHFSCRSEKILFTFLTSLTPSEPRHLPNKNGIIVLPTVVTLLLAGRSPCSC